MTVGPACVGTSVVPTDAPESDGAAPKWGATTLVVVEADSGGRSGLGYSPLEPRGRW
ncbi:MAG: hypothetical protein R3A52_23230 [Polyangiales bacterium]